MPRPTNTPTTPAWRPVTRLPVAGVVGCERGQVGLGQRLLPRAHVSVGDGPGQVGVAGGIAGEDDQVATVGVGGAGR